MSYDAVLEQVKAAPEAVLFLRRRHVWRLYLCKSRCSAIIQ